MGQEEGGEGKEGGRDDAILTHGFDDGAMLSVGVEPIELRVKAARDSQEHQARDDRIRQMREAGESIDQIVSTLGIPWGMWEVVRRIVRKFETEEVLSARSSRFMEEIRNADDLNKEWKAGILMQGLRPNVMTQNAVIRHFESANRKEISLLQLMELTISEQEPPKPGYLLTPLLHIRCVGPDGFWSLVRRLAEADLGERCNREWRKRIPRLMQCSRIVGGQGTWSKPCEPPAWLVQAMA